MEVTSPFRLPRKTPFGVGEHVAEWATGLKKLDQFYAARPVGGDVPTFLRYALETLGIHYSVKQGSLGQIPAIGATVVVANHPLGCVEGVILAELLGRVRSDIKILANYYLRSSPSLTSCLLVSMFSKVPKRSRRTSKHCEKRISTLPAEGCC